MAVKFQLIPEDTKSKHQLAFGVTTEIDYKYHMVKLNVCNGFSNSTVCLTPNEAKTVIAMLTESIKEIESSHE